MIKLEKMFKRIFSSKKDKIKISQIDTSNFDFHEKTIPFNLDSYVELYAGISFEKQLIFEKVIGSNNWDLNMKEGSITFGQYSFPIQIIGSLSFNDNSWMWAWANSQSPLPENLLIQSHELHKLGTAEQIDKLVIGHFPAEEGFEHKMGMLAVGIFNAKSYYCANYGQGTLVVTIDHDIIPEIDYSSFEKIITAFPQLIAGVKLDHKNAFKNYIVDRGGKLHNYDNVIEGLRDNKLVVGVFDDLNRLTSLKGNF